MKTIELICCFIFLATLTSGVKIECDYKMSNFDAIGNLYVCYASIMCAENRATVIEVRGNHSGEKNNTDVKGFWMSVHNSLTTIPDGLEIFFANLEIFYWSNGSISTIDSSTFKPFPNLSIINLDYNKLVSLDSDLFQHTRKLRGIYFRKNLIENVGYGLLIGLTNLTTADFSLNSCINAFANTPEGIQEIKLQMNNHCQPVTTTAISTTPEPNECAIRCTTNKEADEMNDRIEKLETVVAELSLNQCSHIRN